MSLIKAHLTFYAVCAASIWNYSVSCAKVLLEKTSQKLRCSYQYYTTLVLPSFFFFFIRLSKKYSRYKSDFFRFGPVSASLPRLQEQRSLSSSMMGRLHDGERRKSHPLLFHRIPAVQQPGTSCSMSSL